MKKKSHNANNTKHLGLSSQFGAALIEGAVIIVLLSITMLGVREAGIETAAKECAIAYHVNRAGSTGYNPAVVNREFLEFRQIFDPKTHGCNVERSRGGPCLAGLCR